jgi:hypothetical protein
MHCISRSLASLSFVIVQYAHFPEVPGPLTSTGPLDLHDEPLLLRLRRRDRRLGPIDDTECSARRPIMPGRVSYVGPSGNTADWDAKIKIDSNPQQVRQQVGELKASYGSLPTASLQEDLWSGIRSQ